jgi:hypothetical protein
VAGVDFESFQANDEKVFAVIRALEIIDEAGKKIPTSVRKRYPEVPWATMAGMPRQARLDAPGIMHHVMVRGLERRPIFRDDVDRCDFCTRLGGLVEATTLTVYAWALFPNHAHLLLRTGQRLLGGQ